MRFLPAPVRLFFRGFSIVTLTAMNVSQVANQHYLGAFVVGTAISVVWWGNAHAEQLAISPRMSAWVYGLGAGLGTVTGMALMHWFYF